MSALNDKSAYPALLTMPQSPFSPVFSLINLEKSLITLVLLYQKCPMSKITQLHKITDLCVCGPGRLFPVLLLGDV